MKYVHNYKKSQEYILNKKVQTSLQYIVDIVYISYMYLFYIPMAYILQNKNIMKLTYR